MIESVPIIWANYLSMLGFALLGIIVWRIPRKLIFTEAADNRSWRDIRIWASVLIVIQISLYLVFN